MAVFPQASFPAASYLVRPLTCCPAERPQACRSCASNPRLRLKRLQWAMEGCLQKMKAHCLAPGFCLAHADGDEGSFIYLSFSSQAGPAVMASSGPRLLGLAFQSLISSLLRGWGEHLEAYIHHRSPPAPGWGQQGWDGTEAAEGLYGRSSGLDPAFWWAGHRALSLFTDLGNR